MALVGQVVSEKKIFEIVVGRTTDGGTPDHGHPISSPCEPNGSGELINSCLGRIIVREGGVKSMLGGGTTSYLLLILGLQ